MAGPDIKNIEALPVPITGKETGAPEPDTKNLDALLDSLNGSAERFQTLWFSFLGLISPSRRWPPPIATCCSVNRKRCRSSTSRLSCCRSTSSRRCCISSFISIC
jgi:hypothetical protein